MVKDFDPEDPEELVGVSIPGGDADEQLDCLVHEYLLMGWGYQQIIFLFRSPHYGATHQILRLKGEDHVKHRVQQLVTQWRQGWTDGRFEGRMAGQPEKQTQGEVPHAQCP